MTVVDLDTRRREKIGGSEAAAACGIDPYRSRRLLWYEKVNGIEREESEAMRLGTLLQPAIAEIVAERGYEIMPAPADGFVHPERKWMIVHPDGLAALDGQKCIVEIKTRGTGWTDEDERALFPYIMQVQHGMEVLACDVGLLAVLHGGYGGLRLDVREVERDDALIARMVELEQEIVDAVRTLQPPPARGAKSDDDSLKLEFPRSDGSAVRATGDVWQMVKDARLLKEQRDEVDRQYKERVQNIQAYMGEAEQLVSPFDDQACRWPTVTEHRFNAAAFKAAHPSIHAEFVRENSTRRFYLS
jgi:putative phage-type endonuclease